MVELLVKDLENLGIDSDKLTTLTLGEVVAAWRKAAIRTHPDKVGKEFTSAFQELSQSYENVLKYVHSHRSEPNVVSENVDDDAFTKDNFENMNFPQENKDSFTVFVQNELADLWQESLEKSYGIPQVN